MKENITYLDAEGLKADIKRSKTEFAWILRKIELLRQTNAPIYWDVLYNSLSKGNLLENYCIEFAKNNGYYWGKSGDDNYSAQDTRNSLRKRFSFLSDEFARPQVSTRFVKRNENGGFELDEKALEEYYKIKNTYQLTAEQYENAIKIAEGLKGLKLPVFNAARCFYRDEKGEVIPIIKTIAGLVEP